MRPRRADLCVGGLRKCASNPELRKLPRQSQAPSKIALDKTARILRSSADMKTTTLRLRNSVNRSHVRLAFLLIPLACFALSTRARAVCNEGCLTNNNTVLGDDALLNNTGIS